MSLLGSLDLWLIAIVLLVISIALIADVIFELRTGAEPMLLIIYGLVAVVLFYAWKWLIYG